MHLVVSLTSSPRSLNRVVEAFAPLGVSRLLITKLDEVDSFGLLVNVMSRVNKSLSYVTYGQDVPEDLTPGQSARLAGLVLGETPLSGMKHSVLRREA